MSNPLGMMHFRFPDGSVIVWDKITGSTGILRTHGNRSRWVKPSVLHAKLEAWDARFRSVTPPLINHEYTVAILDAPTFRELLNACSQLLGPASLLTEKAST